MQNLFFRNRFVFGVLMACVLALGMQGITDAADLPLTKGSGDFQEKTSGNTFEITFTINQRSNTTSIKNDNKKLVTDGRAITTPSVAAAPPPARINSSGYLVTDIGSTEYRHPESPATTGLYRVSSSQPWTAASGGTDLFVGNTNTNLYYKVGAKAYRVYAPDSDDSSVGDTSAPLTAEPLSQVPLINRYHYNEESIDFQVHKDRTTEDFTDGGDATMTFRLKANTFQRNLPGLTELPGSSLETLPRSVTLICDPQATAEEGVYAVRIYDHTPVADRPDATPLDDRAYIEFTLRVIEDNYVAADQGIAAKFSRTETSKKIRQINDDFTVTGDNLEIRYKVEEGRGTLYAAVSEEATPYKGPHQDLTVHQAAKVFLNTNSSDNEIEASIADSPVTEPTATIRYDYTGDGAVRTPPATPPTPPVTTRGSLSISVSPSTGTTRTVTVTALNAGGTAVPGISVLLNVNNGATLSRSSGGTPLTSTLTLPATAGDYILSATTTADYTGDSETITVTLPGFLSLALIDSQVNGSQNVQVTARNAAGSLETTAVTVTLSGAGISRTISVTGSQNVPIPLPTTSGTLTASATGYNPGSVILPARSTTPTTPTPTPTPTGTAGVANSIEIEGSRTLEGTVGTSTRLRARVLDANDRGVSDVRVTFRILAPGRGRLSQRGNGRAVQVNTDRNGYATASLTPLGGNLIVEAKAAGVSAPVTFIIDVGEETEVEDTTGAARAYKVGEKIPISLQDTLSFRGNRTLNGTTYTCVGSGECVVSYGTLVKGEIRVATKTTASDTGEIPVIDPVVHTAAAQRPPMLWVDRGGIYALVGASVERFAPSVGNAQNLTVGGGKVYWTEQTGESAGTINSADLDGSDVEELKTILAVPMGIAVDTAARKLYWTNSRGRIQRADLDGSGIENVLQNLPGLKDIAVARGNVYWTQYDATAGAGSVGIANSTGRGSPKHMSTGSDTPGSLVISGNKVYWTEMTGTSSGTINSANLNGNDAKELKAIRAVPMGIAVDGSRSKLYWTNSRGRIQSADLDGSKVENVVDGLGGPGDMVLSNSISAPVAGGTSSGSGTTASNKYDVNGDGTVDSKDSDALVVAVAAGLTDAKYDVNGDGKVDINDVVSVSANRSAGAAGAPTLLGKQFSALEVSRLQEQIDLLIATGDRSPAAMRTLIYLQQLIAMARPEKTQLFANYPNPFNPETWMPYELATDTNVRITIYNPQGVVIRTLQLGQQSAGYYTDRERAAYWDGRNALGEQVASGIYFYQLETDEMSLMRKMVILK